MRAPIVQTPGRIALAAQQLGDVDVLDLRRRLRVEPRQAHQAVDQPAHVLFLDRHRREDLASDARLLDRAAAQHVDVAGDHGQRRAQLVRRVGGELPHALFGMAPVVDGASRRWRPRR